MKLIKTIGFFTVVSFLLTIQVKASDTEIEFQSQKRVKNKELISGMVKAKVNYQIIDFNKKNSIQQDNLQYQIYYNNQLKINEKQTTMNSGGVMLKDLDGNGTSEVIIRTFTGGAHCCTNHIIYSWIKNNFIKTETGDLNAGGGIFKDLNKDGKYEFLSDDNAFLYAFSSYAASYPPSKIYQLKEGKLIDVTRQYPKILQERVEDMKKAILESKKETGEINGILAGYVAQNILLGKYKEAWEFMLKNYDRKTEWGLEIYKGDRVVGKYKDFPTALKAFLIQTGYIDK